MKNTLISIFCLISLGIAIWWMADNVVWLGDDLDYQFRMKGGIWESWGHIRTFRQFCESQWIHYQHVNGRIVAHSLVQLFNGILGQQFFAICNAIIYMVFAAFIARCGAIRLTVNSAGVISAICLSVICFITKMMPTCQIGYIWGMLANLMWLSAFYSRKRPAWLTVILMFFAGIIVGNWQESVSIGVCAGLGIWWLSQFFNRHHTIHTFFDWRRSWIMLGYFIGTASNCLAPSTLGRMSQTVLPLSDQLLVSAYSFPAVLLLLLCVIIVGIKYHRMPSWSFQSENGAIPGGVLMIGILTLILFNCVIGIYSNRQLFGANLFAAIALLRLLPRHRFHWAVNLLAVLAVGFTWWVMYCGINEVRRQYEDIVSLHSESNDGSVEYDRMRFMPFSYPLSAKYYEDILGQFDNDLHHSIMKDLKHHKKGKTLKLKPATLPDGEKIERYAPGHFYLTVKEPQKNEPKRKVNVYGHYSILGFYEIPAVPREIELNTYSRRRPPYATAVIIPEIPFFTTDSIALQTP